MYNVIAIAIFLFKSANIGRGPELKQEKLKAVFFLLKEQSMKKCYTNQTRSKNFHLQSLITVLSMLF